MSRHVHGRVVRAYVARSHLGPAHSALGLLSSEIAQANGTLLESLAQPREGTLPFSSERCQSLGEFGGATGEPVESLDQALGPLRVLEPRLGTGHRADDGRYLCVESTERGIHTRAHLLREQQFACDVLGDRRQLPRADAVAEELGRDVRQLMRLVDDDRVRARQQVAEALLLEHEVGHQQVVIHDDDVRRLRFPACRQHEALVVNRALRAEAVLARRRDPGPDGIGFTDAGQLGDVTALRDVRPRTHLGNGQCDVTTHAARVRLLFSEVEPVPAKVVRTALQQCDAHRTSERATD